MTFKKNYTDRYLETGRVPRNDRQIKTYSRFFSFVERVASSNISILICGESGTGKEVVAHAIHQQSQEKIDSFVVVNCGAIPENLLESELFGHERGSFTGAHARKSAVSSNWQNGGTLFLDQIGELVPALQVKLLRFLQDRKIERVGGSAPIELECPHHCRNHRDGERRENRIFRKDLYYRLKVVPLELPPLRERKDDIIPWLNIF